MATDQNAFYGVVSKSIADKSINTFLGFIEGLILDGTINELEVDALIEWNGLHPEVLSEPPFDTILPYLAVFRKDSNSDEYKARFSALFDLCKSRKYYKANTSDIQRLHGILAGMACDKNISYQELAALNDWMRAHDYLEDDVFFQEIYSLLRPVRTKKEMTEQDVNKIYKQILKYVDIDNHGVLRKVVQAEGNPDFYRGEIQLANGKYCFTGASSRFSKKQWKDLIESNGAVFVDDMTSTVDYLVVCNKGNSAWAHVSYGRKFEHAKKLQASGSAIRILTEDDFVAAVDRDGVLPK